jgi:predicted nucleic acid-binding protein
MRLFLDANVLFTAAHNPRGKATLVIELGNQGYWELYSSPYALEEARRNLERKFPHSLDDLGALQRGVHLVEHRARHYVFDLPISTRVDYVEMGTPKHRAIIERAGHERV